jgi:hypothetical protein
LHFPIEEKFVADLGYIGQDHQIIRPLPATSFNNVFQNKMMTYLRQNVERMNKSLIHAQSGGEEGKIII